MNLTEDKPQAGPPASGAPSVDDDLVVRAVREYLALVEAGARPDRLAFASRYPQIAEALAECLAGLDFVQAAVPELSDPAADRVATALEGDGTPAGGMLGEFRILREIGRGGMGIVYEAEQMSLGRRVALKVLPFAATLDPKQLQRFKNEAQAAAHLQHQNIVPVHSVGCERGVHFYAMQFIEGQSVAAVIADLRRLSGKDETGPAAAHVSEVADAMASGRLAASGPVGARPPARPDDLAPPAPDTIATAGLSTERSITSRAYFRTVACLGEQAAQALEHAHQLGVVHRDIKPANLLVDVRGNLWVADFGLAQFQTASPLTLTGDLIGTLRYMSPEQAEAKRLPIDHRTDIYALGVTLYELLTLEPAFPGDNRHELLRQIAEEEPRPPRRLNKTIPAELETIVGKAMEKSPTDRYATAQELADDLRRFLEDKTIRARRPGIFQRGWRWARRYKSLLLAITLPVLPLLLLSGSQLWSNRRQRVATELAVAEDLKEAKIWEARKQWAKGLQVLERATARLEGSDLGSLQNRVEEWRRKELDGAIHEYNGVIDDYPNDYQALYLLAHALRSKGKLEEAISVFKEAINLNPRDAYAIYDVPGFDVDAYKKKAARAAEFFEQIGVLAPQGKWKEAAIAQERGLALAPNFYGNWVHIAQLHLQCGDLQGYQRDCLEFLQRFGDTSRPGIANLIAKTLVLSPVGLRYLEKAIQLSERAVSGTEKYRLYPWYLADRALVEYRAGHYRAAMAWLDKAEQQLSRSADKEVNKQQCWPYVYLYKAMVLAKNGTGDKEQARTFFRRGVELADRQFPKLALRTSFDWGHWVYLHIIRTEAEALLKEEGTDRSTGPVGK